VQQFVFDEYTKCKGLTQEELDDDIKLLKMSQYTIPSAKYKISNPISTEKRQIIRSLYDTKDIGSDLAKQNNQLQAELDSLQHQIEKTRYDVMHNQTQITLSELDKQVMERQFALVQTLQHQHVQSLSQYHLQCQQAMKEAQKELDALLSDTTQQLTVQQQIQSAIQLIVRLKEQIQCKEAMICMLQQNELSKKGNNNSNTRANSKNAEILKMNEKLNRMQQEMAQQQKTNNQLKLENEQIKRELDESKRSFNAVYTAYKETDRELTVLKYRLNQQQSEFDEVNLDTQQKMNTLQLANQIYDNELLSRQKQENQNLVLNASVSLDYYKQLLVNDGLMKANKILQAKYNELDKKYKRLNHKKNNNVHANESNNHNHKNNKHNESNGNVNELSQYQLENIIIEEKQSKNQLKKQLHEERQKYFERVITFRDDLVALYKKTEAAASENSKIKKDAKKKTFELQRQNERLRDDLKQSHSNLRVKQTEAESKHKESEHQHQQAVKEMNGSKVDLEKRVFVLKSAIEDLSVALSDSHLQLLSFQKHVYDEMGCAIPADSLLMLPPYHQHPNAPRKQPSSPVSKPQHQRKKQTAPPQPPSSAPQKPETTVTASPTVTTPKSNKPTLPASSQHSAARNQSNPRKRNRDEMSVSSQSTPQQTPTKRRRKSEQSNNGQKDNHSNTNTINIDNSNSNNNNTVDMSTTNNSNSNTNTSSNTASDDIVEDDSSSSSSEVSYGSHLTDDEVYTFQGGEELEKMNDAEHVFYNILNNTKTETVFLWGDYIKITRRGHPDYIGRVESMFLDKKTQKKKVCVTVYQLASDMPKNVRSQLKLVDEMDPNHGGIGVFHEGKREYVQLVFSKPRKLQFDKQPANTKIYGVGRIHTNKKVSLWFPKKHLQFKVIEKKTSGRDVFFCRYQWDKNANTLTRIEGTMDAPQSALSFF